MIDDLQPPPNRETFRSPKERRESRRRGQSRTHRGPLDRWLEGLLFAVVLGSVLAIGSVHVPSLLVVGTVGIATGLLAMFVHRRDMNGWPITLPAAGMFLLALYTAVQAIPLPAGLVAALAPGNADVWAHALSPLGLPGPAWHPISLDPGATWVEVLKALTYTAMAVASSVVAYRRGATFGVATVFFSALIVGILTLVHGLSGMTKVFGIYEPIHSFASWAIGPLLNVNHLAGYLNLGALCGLGILLMRKSRIPRWVAGLGAATILGVGISTVSRGGVALLPLGFAILVLLLRSRPESLREQTVSNRWLHGLTLLTAVGGASLAALAFTTRHWDELMNQDLSKLQIFDWAKPMVSDHAWFGAGRGAFETVYPAYRPTTGHQLWTNPENLFVQWAAEWGLPVTVAAVVFFAWMMRPSRMGATRSAVAAGAVAGIFILVLQNWVDFSLEMPGVAIAAVVLIGSCWGDTRRRGVQRWSGDNRISRLLTKFSLGTSVTDKGAARTYVPLAAFGLLGVFVVLMAGLRGMPTALQDRLAFHEISKGPPMPKIKFDPLVKAAMLRHPSEPFLPLVGAERAWRVRDDNPIPFLQRVFERAKVYGRAHLLMADILFARGAKEQALMELKFACRDEPGLATPAVAAAIEHTQTEEDLGRIVPEGPDGVVVLDTLGAWMHKRNPAAGERFDKRALELDPDRLAPRVRRAQDLVDALSKEGISEKEKKGLADRIEEHASHIERAEPHSSRAAQLRARALVALGKPEKADKLLETACDHVRDRHACMQARVPILASLDRPKELDELLEATKAGCTGGKACAQTYLWLGRYQRGRKNLGGASNAFLKATRHDPQNADAWVQLGDVSTALGTHAQAVRAYEQAVRLRPDDEGLRKKLEAARGKMLGGFLGR